MGSRTSSKRVLQFPVGQKKWKKLSASQMQQWCTGRARSSLEKMNVVGEGGGTDNKKFSTIAFHCPKKEMGQAPENCSLTINQR